MKSLLDVKSEIAGIISQQGYFENKRAESRAKKRLAFLNVVRLYIESEPDEYFIAKEIHRLESAVRVLYDRFDSSHFKDPKEALKKHEKDSGIPELKEQIKALRFIKN